MQCLILERGREITRTILIATGLPWVLILDMRAALDG